jgi:large subunit ribosomal protein L23
MLKPVVSEKSYELVDKENCYTFIASKEDTKNTIKAKVEKMFDVSVEKVRVVNIRKPSRFNRLVGKESKGKQIKKFYVYLEEGNKIEDFIIK